MRRYAFIASAAAVCALAGFQARAASIDIDFEGLPEGTSTKIFDLTAGAGLSSGATGPVHVQGHSTRLPGDFPDDNSAVVFDSSCPSGCPFSDRDIATPHADFGGPGIGDGGAAGSPFQNDTARGNILILPENVRDADGDLIVDDVIGSDDPGYMNFDLSDYNSAGTVTVVSVTIMDVEFDEGETPALIELSGPGIATATIAQFDMGNGGVATIPDINLAGVSNMRIHFKGSGATVGAVFDEQPDIPGGVCWITTGGFHNSGGTSGMKEYTFGGNVGPPPSGSWQVTEHNPGGEVRLFHTNDVHITECITIPGTGPGQPGGKKGFKINQAFFEGVGSLDHVPGFPFTGFVIDRGEPSGKNGNDTDEFYIEVRDPATNAVVFETQFLLDGGNVQIHPPNKGSTKTKGPKK